MNYRTIIAGLGLIVGMTGSVSAMTDAELKEMSAFIINANGYLCARVTSISPTSGSDNYRVSCIENRDGSGRVSYIMNARNGSARPN